MRKFVERRLSGCRGLLLLLLLWATAACRDAERPPAQIVFPTPTPTPLGYFAGTPQPGGVWTRLLSANPLNFNPLLAADSASTAVHAMLYPVLVRRDAVTGQYGAALAERWETSADGLTWTFYLRAGVLWSDEEAVDAEDFKFTYEALRLSTLDSPYRQLVEPIAAIEVVNPLTVRVVLRNVQCDLLERLRVGWLPSHRFAADFSDLDSNTFNQAPDLSAGPFLLQSYIPDDSVVLRRNPSYWQGPPLIERMVYRIVPDAEERLRLLLAGELDESPLTPDQLIDLLEMPALKVAKNPVDAYDFLAFNLANPVSPQRGLREDGALQVQDPHPLLAERAVRQAAAHAIDYTGIVNAIYLGQAYPLAANVLPIVPWAFDPALSIPEYSPDRARALLEASGWIDLNRDGIREKEIQILRLTLIVPEVNPYYLRIAEIVRDQLNAVGFDIRLQPLSTSAFTQQLFGQRYDLALSGWAALGVDPDDHELWQAAFDRPGSGFNFTSYQNPQRPSTGRSSVFCTRISLICFWRASCKIQPTRRVGGGSTLARGIFTTTCRPGTSFHEGQAGALVRLDAREQPGRPPAGVLAASTGEFCQDRRGHRAALQLGPKSCETRMDRIQTKRF
ncbi:MAG: ABC transporter substrate-binding protein [Caldilinea sp.]|nr:ABC transporter substrate-binding protein [Caldilinea sp.]